MADLAAVSAAVRSYTPENPDAAAVVQDLLISAASGRPDDASYCEALLACVVESLAQAGDSGKDLLEQLLLEVLPHLAALAGLSQQCSQSLFSICGLAAAACPPRDTITAFLEVMDQLLAAESPSSHALQFLCGVLSLLPQQLAKLSRRKAAFTTECLLPAAALAKAHGDVLQGWMLAQLQLAASQSSAMTTAGTAAAQAGVSAAGAHAASDGGSGFGGGAAADTLRRLDTFLAANWQLYEEFVADLVHKVLPQEADAAAAASCQQAVGKLILQLLLHLTAAWPPPQLAELTKQLLAAPAAASQLPSTDSVTAPAPILLRVRGKAAAGSPNTFVDPSNNGTAQHSSTRGSMGSSSGSAASDAAGVVVALLRLLQSCRLCSWQALAGADNEEAAGAALAALYACSLEAGQSGSSGLADMPATAVEAQKIAWHWCSALAAVSEGNPLIILKIIALIQTVAAQLATLPSIPAATAAANTAATAPQQAGDVSDADVAAAEQLLPHLQPCISLLASTIASGVGVVLRAQATVALQQLLEAPGQAVCYCCLKPLLDGGHSSDVSSTEARLDPEVAALLMQEVRQQLARHQGAAGPFSSSGSVQLVLPWLRQDSIVGWRDADTLADNANAVCAALAVVRLAVLKQQPAAAGNAASGSQHAGGESSQLGALRVLLQQPLQVLSAAVSDALQRLQAVNSVEQGVSAEQLTAVTVADSSGTQQQQQQQRRVCIPGDAQGSGQAVDAWLAVSRVQDVLDRVLELLE